VTALNCVRVDAKMKPIEGSAFQLKADLVLLAMGFVSPRREGLLADLGVLARRARQCRSECARLRLLARQGLCVR